ncbi:MAG: hypothetical protein JWM85_3220 [Acidimicrobiaceae bacterium]|nr:hypothetical protein [Acidimicrobiaceae bacterium]
MSKLVLREFAKVGVIQVVDLRADGRSFPRSIDDAAAENDYNTIELKNGSLSDEAEVAIANRVEGPAGAVIARIARGGWMEEDELEVVARLVLFQLLRVPTRRDEGDALADLLMKLTVAAEGPMGMRRSLENHLGRPPTEEEVTEAWVSVGDLNWNVSRQSEAHLVDSFKLLDEFLEPFTMTYSWHVMRWDRRHLLTSDSPIILAANPEMPQIYGVGMANAQVIYFPVSRSCCLLLRNRVDPDWDVPNGREIHGTTTSARAVSRMMAENATRWLYHHPDDSLAELLGPRASLPMPQSVTYETAHVRRLQHRLKVMAEYAAEHPDEPHPMSPGGHQINWADFPDPT